jgi:WhiB family redox-sensing transcriptional regulator
MDKYTQDTWLEGAQCVTADPEIFFPGIEVGWADRAAEAKSYCGVCPIAVACLMSAMTEGYEGIWGGTTTHERKLMRKDRKALEEQVKWLSV